MINDVTYLMDESLNELAQIASIQKEMDPIRHNISKGESKISSQNDSEVDMSDLDELEYFMKLHCIRKFDKSTCKSIMYTRDNSKLGLSTCCHEVTFIIG